VLSDHSLEQLPLSAVGPLGSRFQQCVGVGVSPQGEDDGAFGDHGMVPSLGQLTGYAFVVHPIQHYNASIMRRPPKPHDADIPLQTDIQPVSARHRAADSGAADFRSLALQTDLQVPPTH
jgi:hypothetical protein